MSVCQYYDLKERENNNELHMFVILSICGIVWFISWVTFVAVGYIIDITVWKKKCLSMKWFILFWLVCRQLQMYLLMFNEWIIVHTSWLYFQNVQRSHFALLWFEWVMGDYYIPFNNISVPSERSVLLEEESGGLRETTGHWQSWTH